MSDLQTNIQFRQPDFVADHPATPAPIYHQIPAELKPQAQWVVWAWEIGKNEKWTKVPYNPKTGAKASTTAPRTWGTFQQAKAAYLANPIGNAGIGYVFSKDDPYIGIDLDHCRNPETGEISNWAQAHIARFATYAEVSPSQTGVKMIVRGMHPAAKGIKKSIGEMYAHGRFFTITGATLISHTSITKAQEAIDVLYNELRGAEDAYRLARNGTAGAGDRAALAASHSDAEWEQARQLARTKGEHLLERFLKATQDEGTQGYYAARLQWAELHARAPHIGLYRVDGELDASQCRAVMAYSLVGRGFRFPEYVAIMSHHFGSYCLDKWGTKQAFREELASLYQNALNHIGYEPRPPKRLPDVAIKPKGRACNHASNVERVFTLIQDQRAGNQAIIKTADLAADAGMHRVTLSGILAELIATGRITTRRFGQYGGLVITFSDVAIVADLPFDMPIDASLEETEVSSCVSSETAEPGYSSKEQPEPPALHVLVAEYLDCYTERPAERLNKKTGEIDAVVYKHTAKRFADLVTAEYPQIRHSDAIEAYRKEQNHRAELIAEVWQRFFAQLRMMTSDELIGYINGRCRAEVASLCKAVTKFDVHLYQTRLKLANKELKRRGLKMPAKPTLTQARVDQGRSGGDHRAQLYRHNCQQDAKRNGQALLGSAFQRVEYEQHEMVELCARA